MSENRLILNPQPTTLEDSVKLKVLSHWCGRFAEILNILYEELSSNVVLRRTFTSCSIAYEGPIGASVCRLFEVRPAPEMGLRSSS